MIKTGLFGGSFNPIHIGHISLARHLVKAAELDEIWFMVSPQNPFKTSSTDLLDDSTRLSIVRQALCDDDNLSACDYEFGLPKPSYTWHTLQSISRDYPDRQFTLIIGGDNWLSFPRWYHAADILANFNIVVYPRPDSPIDPQTLPHNVKLTTSQLYDISSTDIRKRVKDGKSIHGLVPDNIIDMVQKAYSD